MLNRFLPTASRAIVTLGLCCGIAVAQPPAPRVFFSDLVSGPNTGGQNNKGAFVTIWGKNFGATQGTSSVRVGGGPVDNYPVWTDTKISFQLGSSAATGNITVSTSSGASNGVPFTVRSGNIYFVSTAGNDSNSGSFASPWATILKAKNTIAAGDIAYIRNGVTQTTVDDYNGAVAIARGGTAASPCALVGYPGETATIGTASGLTYGLRTPSISGNKDYWVIAGLKLIANDALDLVTVTGWRVVGNDFSCPNGSGQSACVHTDTTTNLSFYGNYVHNVGDTAGSIDKYFHAVYFTTNSNHIDVGWNTVVPNPNGSTTSGGCRAIQFYSTGGSDQFDLHVHDNLVHDAICDGINFATVNADGGTVEAYNNVVYHVGTGPDPYNGSSNYSCVLASSSAVRSSKVELYNNSFYDCGPRKTSDAGGVCALTPVRMRNNVTYQLAGESYLNSNCGSSSVSGNNNEWFGLGAGTSATTANINTDPLFVNAAARDFHLQVGSPAKDAGVTISGLGTDFDGVIRPQGSAYDLGAYEYFQGSGSILLTCDLNSDGVVNSLDVQIAVNQTLGATSCSSADLDQDGRCDVVDIQRVINAVLGQACRIGP
jgi:hypothetical protein